MVDRAIEDAISPPLEEGFLESDFAPIMKWMDERFDVEFADLSPYDMLEQVPLNDIYYSVDAGVHLLGASRRLLILLARAYPHYFTLIATRSHDSFAEHFKYLCLILSPFRNGMTCTPTSAREPTSVPT